MLLSCNALYCRRVSFHLLYVRVRYSGDFSDVVGKFRFACPRRHLSDVYSVIQMHGINTVAGISVIFQ